jgi:negative regulator of flagellin synthesis FlgM
MINGVGPSVSTRIGQAKDGAKVGKATETTAVSAPATEEQQPTSLVSALAEAGPPIDAQKIAAIRSAISQGRYPIDAKANAARMITLDLPGGRA